MRMNLSGPYRRLGQIVLWIILIIVVFSLILTTCEGRFFNTSTCANTATATVQPGSNAQATATTTGGINTPTPNTSTMHFWRPGVIAVSLKLNNSAQNVSATDIVSCLNSVLGKGVVSTLKDDSKTPALIILKTIKVAVLFLSVDDKQMVNIINKINSQIKALSPIPNVTITGASPDWLSIGGSAKGPPAKDPGDYIGGSPIGPAQDASNAQPNCSSNLKAGVGQDVYVLDTIVPLDSIPTTPDAWPTLRNGQTIPKNCDLLTLGSKISMTAYSFSTNMRQQGNNDPLLSQQFKEHGIFISELIHHLAPNAKIHLIQVLNDYGVGDLQSLIWGLNQVSGSRAIVNMSLAVGPPPACVESIWQNLSSWQQLHPNEDPESLFASCINASTGDVGNDPYQHYKPLGDVISGLVNIPMTLVAAAGNDSADTPNNPLPADVPAAYCGVISVAAAGNEVGDNWHYNDPTQLAPFSNTPSWFGHCLSGSGQGNDQLHKVIADGQNICSLFLQSPNDLALWQGTSFATAFVSGNLAAGNLVVQNGQNVLANPPGHSFSEDQPCG